MKTFPAFYYLSFFLVISNSNAFGITFQERFAAQRAIEDVFWNHTIWPSDNPQPKPPRTVLISDAEMRHKIEVYMRKSVALVNYSHRPITPQMLQSEINRMARETEDPNMLRELWSALHNDPYLVAECLARPVLLDRLSAEMPSFEQRFEAAGRNQKANFQAPSYSYHLPEIANEKSVLFRITNSTSAGSWKSLPTTGAPSARSDHTAVWTGTQMIIWGGKESPPLGGLINTGGVYTSSTNSWSSTSTAAAPSARESHTAVWDGSEMIVWGGSDSTFRKTGAKYKPSTDSWTAITTTNAPRARIEHTAIWTGNSMLVWGGATKYVTGCFCYQTTRTGGQYNPNTDSWTPTTTTGAPSARYLHVAIWTGTFMMVWGGNGGLGLVSKKSARYYPSTDVWVPVTATGAPSKRERHTGVWAGGRVVIWGGIDGNDHDLKTGGKYNPTNDAWTPISTINAPSGRQSHVAVSNGNGKMIVWGGSSLDPYTLFKTGGEYDPVADSWVATTTTGAPSAREQATAIWSGTRMIVWGGYPSPAPTNTGGKFKPN